jgi:hypothetical protein
MKHIQTYEALTIKQYRPFHKEAEKVKYKERYKDIFLKYKEKYDGDRDAFRIYIPLIREKKKSQTQHEVEQILRDFLNIDISNPETFDYVWGKAKFPGSKNWTGIGKMLGKKPEWSNVLKAFAEDETRTLKGRDTDLEVCISRHPYDVVGADTDRPWINCMTLYHFNRFKKEWIAKGGSISDLKHDVRQGALTAFLIKKSDRNINAPLANIGIKPYINEENPNDIVLVPENRMYGMRNLDFSITVFAWCDEVNGDKIGYYKIAKGLHMDNFARKDNMIGADIKPREDIEEYEYQDPRSYYARKHLPPDPWKGKFENAQHYLGKFWKISTNEPELTASLLKIIKNNEELDEYLYDPFFIEEIRKRDYILIFHYEDPPEEYYFFDIGGLEVGSYKSNYEYQGIIKLTDEDLKEAELYSAAKKYNL